MKKHIIFDFDGTIVNSHAHNQNLFVESFREIFPEADEIRLREVHEMTVGESMEFVFGKALEVLSLTYDPKIIVNDNEELYIRKAEDIKFYEFVEEFLQNLVQKGKQLHICTNRGVGSISAVVNKNGYKKLFTSITSCNDMGFPKPDPKGLNDLCERFNIKKEEAIFIGDSYVDKNFAINAGIDFIIIDHKMHENNFFENIVNSFM